MQLKNSCILVQLPASSLADRKAGKKTTMLTQANYRETAFGFLALLIALCSRSQMPDFPRVLNLHPGDSTNITQLIACVVSIKKGTIIAWFPKDSLPEIQMSKMVETLNTGMKAAEAVIRAPLPWQVHQPSDAYTFYFREHSFVSHASGAGFVSIPFWRIKEGGTRAARRCP